MELTEWDLVQKCQNGDLGAFEELAAKYYHRVFMAALGVLNHRDDAMEVAQEAFYRAFKSIKRFEGGSSFYTWLYRIAMNLAIDFQRRRKRNATELTENIDDAMFAQGEIGSDPYREVRDRELGGRLRAAIDGLTPDHKAVIVLRAIEGLSYKDIGRIVGCSEGTVMSRLHYARKKLQEKLGSDL